MPVLAWFTGWLLVTLVVGGNVEIAAALLLIGSGLPVFFVMGFGRAAKYRAGL